MREDFDFSNRMRVLVYSATCHETDSLKQALRRRADTYHLEVIYIPAKLSHENAALCRSVRAICIYATDTIPYTLLSQLRDSGVQLIAQRFAGGNCIDVAKALDLGVQVAKTPRFAHVSVAEFAVAGLLALVRGAGGGVGFEIGACCVGVLGGGCVAGRVVKIMRGFGCNVMMYDAGEEGDCSLLQLVKSCDVIFLHAPLTPATYHVVGRKLIAACKRGVRFVNCSRGALMDLQAVMEGLKTGNIGGLFMDAYMGENALFWRADENDVMHWEMRVLKSLPNVIITARLATLTEEGLADEAAATVHTLMQFWRGDPLDHAVAPPSSA